MASEDKKPEPFIVQCGYCGKMFDWNDKQKNKDARTYGDFGNKREMIYFCRLDCLFAKVLGLIKKGREFLLGLENGR